MDYFHTACGYHTAKKWLIFFFSDRDGPFWTFALGMNESTSQDDCAKRTSCLPGNNNINNAGWQLVALGTERCSTNETPDIKAVLKTTDQLGQLVSSLLSQGSSNCPTDIILENVLKRPWCSLKSPTRSLPLSRLGGGGANTFGVFFFFFNSFLSHYLCRKLSKQRFSGRHTTKYHRSLGLLLLLLSDIRKGASNCPNDLLKYIRNQRDDVTPKTVWVSRQSFIINLFLSKLWIKTSQSSRERKHSALSYCLIHHSSSDGGKQLSIFK